VEEGRVVCEDQEGTTLFAEPDRAVEKVAEGDFRTLPVAAGNAADFRRAWMDRRLAAFKVAAPRLVRLLAVRYELLRARFDRAYQALMDRRSILDKWFNEDRRQQPEDQTQMVDERRQISAALLEAQRVQYLFSRAYYRMLALKRFYETQARWSDPPGFSTQQFFRRVENEAGLVAERLRTVRYVAKLFVKRHGSLPLERLQELQAATTG
ncbi:hypothetical protein, partial [Salinispira pacifica]